ncbi:MAG TPA: hypothetical protein VHP33_38210 [Polyangiaceae bacterium]|nr:hypothetical protein [Polyangiaceae bacterium]
MKGRRLAWRLGAVLSLTSFVVWAEPSAPEAAARVVTDAAEPGAAASALVVLVGAAARETELRALLLELLGHRGADVEVTTRERFDRHELLGDSAKGQAVRVFVVPGRAGSVGLYFRAPDGARFLVRSVPLRSGFDEVGREQLGQIIETSVTSLLQSSDGMTREEARVALERQASDEGDRAPQSAPQGDAPSPTPKRGSDKVSAPVAPADTTGSTTLEGWLAARYGASFNGGGLGVAHGPGVELGFGSLFRRVRVRARGVGQRDFSRQLSASGVAADLASLRLGVALDVGGALGRHQWLFASLGVVREHTQVTPRAATGSSVVPAAAFESTASVAHVELSYELGGSLVRVAVGAGADIGLVETHYDVARDGRRERVATPWLVRPTASIAVGLVPQWGPF